MKRIELFTNHFLYDIMGVMIMKNKSNPLNILAILIPIPIFYFHGGFFAWQFVKVCCLFLPLIITSGTMKRGLLLGICVGATITSIIGLLAYYGISFSKELVVELDGVLRLQSTLGYANTAAVCCGVGVLLCGYYYCVKEKYKFLIIFVGLINLFAFILTFSRMGLGCFLFTIIVILNYKYNQIRIPSLVGFLLLLSAIAVIFVTGNEHYVLGSTLASRLIYYQDAIKLLIKYPFGVGTNGWVDAQYMIQSAIYSVKYVHNGFLQFALDGGGFALLGFVFFIVFIFNRLHKKYKESHNLLTLCLIGLFTFVILHSFVDIDLTFSTILIIIGVIGSFAINIRKYVRKPVCILIALFVIISVTYSFYAPKKFENIESISRKYYSAKISGDKETAFEMAKRWFESAPRQQLAVTEYYGCLRENRKFDEIEQLRQKVNELNNTKNYFTQYIDKEQNIILEAEHYE